MLKAWTARYSAEACPDLSLAKPKERSGREGGLT